MLLLLLLLFYECFRNSLLDVVARMLRWQGVLLAFKGAGLRNQMRFRLFKCVHIACACNFFSLFCCDNKQLYNACSSKRYQPSCSDLSNYFISAVFLNLMHWHDWIWLFSLSVIGMEFFFCCVHSIKGEKKMPISIVKWCWRNGKPLQMLDTDGDISILKKKKSILYDLRQEFK